MNLVTGATGHIGNVMVRNLLARGEDVRALVLPDEDHSPLEEMNVECVEGNVLKPDTLRKALQGVKNVYHLAGIISIMPGKNELVHKVNVEGTRNIIKESVRANINRLIYTSSIHALARVPHGITIDESIPFDPEHAISAYDRSKAEASLEVVKACKEGLDAVIVCPTGVIGPYDYRRSEVGEIILESVQEKPQFYVDGAYDFVDVRDVAQGHILACEKGRTGEVYILSGENISVPGLVETLWNITGRGFKRLKIPLSLARFSALFTPIYYRLAKAKPRFTPYSLATLASNSVISHAKALRELGYSPRPIRESLEDTVEWFRENRHLLVNPT